MTMTPWNAKPLSAEAEERAQRQYRITVIKRWMKEAKDGHTLMSWVGMSIEREQYLYAEAIERHLTEEGFEIK